MNNKQLFYIFSSIDGIFFDSESAYNIHGPFLRRIDSPIMKKSSVTAFNKLLSELEREFDTKLIITSHRRENLPVCIKYLNDNGLIYNKPIFATSLSNEPRGKKILNFMQKDNLTPERKPTLKTIAEKLFNQVENNEKFKNYVVIDSGNYFKLKDIPKSHIIKTNYKTCSLTEQQVDEFLDSLIYKQQSFV